MKHLLIAVIIAILIGTIQAVKTMLGNPNKSRTCTFDRAVLSWKRSFLHREEQDVTSYI